MRPKMVFGARAGLSLRGAVTTLLCPAGTPMQPIRHETCSWPHIMVTMEESMWRRCRGVDLLVGLSSEEARTDSWSHVAQKGIGANFGRPGFYLGHFGPKSLNCAETPQGERHTQPTGSRPADESTFGCEVGNRRCTTNESKARFGCVVVGRFELWEAAVEARSSNCEFGRDRCTDNGGPPFTAHRLQASPLLGQATCG